MAIGDVLEDERLTGFARGLDDTPRTFRRDGPLTLRHTRSNKDKTTLRDIRILLRNSLMLVKMMAGGCFLRILFLVLKCERYEIGAFRLNKLSS